MQKLSTLLIAVSLLTLASHQAQASSGNQDMPGLEQSNTTSVSQKQTATAEDDIDAQIAAEEARAKQLQEQEAKRKRLEELKAANDQKEKSLGQKIGHEVDKGLEKTGTQVQRFGKHIKKGKF